MKEEKIEIKIIHPEYGHVIFSKMSARQMELLENYAKILELSSKYPNDHDFGKEVRALLNK